MPDPKSTVKSTARSERSRAIYASLPKDAKGRLMKRQKAAGDPAPSPTPPAGGPASADPFVERRGLRRFLRRS